MATGFVAFGLLFLIYDGIGRPGSMSPEWFTKVLAVCVALFALQAALSVCLGIRGSLWALVVAWSPGILIVVLLILLMFLGLRY
jgi:hypothetical protein